MARRAGAFKSEKRKKELLRQKKQEQKRQKRHGKEPVAEGQEAPPAEAPVSEEGAVVQESGTPD